MALLDDIRTFASAAAKQGAKTVKNTGRIAALKLNSYGAQEDINKLYAKIGEKYYKKHGLAPEAGFEKLCDQVTELKSHIQANDASINEIKIDGVIDEVVAEPED